MTVIDVGCARYGGDYSIERLIEMFHPTTLIGMDPAAGAWKGYVDDDPGDWSLLRIEIAPGVDVQIHRLAAWTYDGEVRFLEDGLNGQVGDVDHWPLVRCLDLAAFIDRLPAGPLILKLDAEGAEFDLLEHLIATGADLRLTRLLVEWHHVGQGKRRRAIERAMTCPVENWRW